MSAFDSDTTNRPCTPGPAPASGPLCDVDGECVTHTGVGRDTNSTVRTHAELADTVHNAAIPTADQADQLQRWLSFLEPRFACGERHSSTHASWVFRGVERDSNTAVAVKLLKDSRRELRNAFSVEALLLSQLEHPGIVRYMAHGELAEGGAYIVTEWLEGEELGARLARGPLAVGEAITLVARAANVLAAAHERGIVHLDLKPSNLFLADGDLANIRLLDFGIARLTRSVVSDPDEDFVAGTPGYMAPEQVLGEALSPATDVFALGCVLYRCIAGRRIFEGNQIELMTKTVEETVPLLGSILADVHPVLDQLLASMLNPDPAKRPADATQVLAEIAALPPELLDDIAPSARALLSPSGLTVAERVPTTVVLVRHAPADRAALASSADGRKRYSSYFETLADGSWIALPRGNATLLDQSLHAARLTLDVRAQWPRAAIAVVAGRTVDRAATPQLHELLAEAEACVASARAGQILLDPASAALVSDKFLLAEVESGALLLAERSASLAEDRFAGSTPCLGREAELTSLLSLARDAFERSKARVVLLTGLAGIGKSSLLAEFLRRIVPSAGGERPTVWSVYADPMSAGSALHLVSAIVEAEPGPASSGLLRLLNPDEPDSMRAGELRPAGSVEAVHRALTEHVEARLAQGPLLLCLEDIHWADLGSLRAIDHLLSALSDRPLLIAATARPEVHELYPDLWQRRSVQDLRLSELSEADAERVVALRLGPAPGDVRARIVQRARGNAFLLHELIRAEVEGRGDEISETAQGVVQSRLRALAPDARRVLRAASILGDPFTPRGVTFLLGEGSDESDVERWLNLLVSREVLRRRDDAQPSKTALVFAHALMRDAAYDLLTESDRTLGHQLAARWFETAERSDPMITALHHARAGDSAGAGRWYFRGTLEAFKIGDFSATTGAAEQALACELNQQQRGHVQAVAAHAYRLLGNVEQSKRLSADALRSLPPNSPLWREAARTAMMAGASTGRHRDG
ncbi:MAG TPA: AAA family ATPase [Polyangiaceae bacterium]|nr:AAA family ATPase [Polyangiaceae bacterium]